MLDTLVEIFVPSGSVVKRPKFITGYWENWNTPINPGPGSSSDASYYANDIEDFTHVIYSFLTLSPAPNPW